MRTGLLLFTAVAALAACTPDPKIVEAHAALQQRLGELQQLESRREAFATEEAAWKPVRERLDRDLPARPDGAAMAAAITAAGGAPGQPGLARDADHPAPGLEIPFSAGKRTDDGAKVIIALATGPVAYQVPAVHCRPLEGCQAALRALPRADPPSASASKAIGLPEKPFLPFGANRKAWEEARALSEQVESRRVALADLELAAAERRILQKNAAEVGRIRLQSRILADALGVIARLDPPTFQLECEPRPAVTVLADIAPQSREYVAKALGAQFAVERVGDRLRLGPKPH